MGIVILILAVGLAARMVITALPRSTGDSDIASRDAQIRGLREEMDTLQSEVRRLSEEQSFMVGLLGQGQTRSPGALPAPGLPTNNPESR
ncbi:hypothetical protein [Longimicrobium terrae]|uniref:Uncharacterized protein n=1 Tax=Longimicrobium terrae TaxID=1639882 RepID=A0A841H529_9BACT|nr:hypothetical protein [Longimicrobium terrae]MBB4638839.1 hypothetical protein [Longimicrobium terrae]MBB6073078.1 hypothetical protein [Longimicrobium terrae]NNC30230.1 hypothetical protein [Longimicrobium terrae]